MIENRPWQVNGFPTATQFYRPGNRLAEAATILPFSKRKFQ
jgi:hypothetical protein